MIRVSNLKKSYGEQVIFDKVDFAVSPGERVGLVGRNGHGKTTLFRVLLGEEEPDAGVIHIPKQYTLGHLSQQIRFTEDSVLKEAALDLKPTDDGIDQTYKAKAVLHGLGFFEDDFHRSPLELSGGFQVRLNLAKVLVSEPNLLLLDEPTNYLDIVSLRWLARFLLAWKSELMLITHDRAFMDRVTTHTMGIHRCKIKKVQGPTRKLYEQILQEEEVYEQTRVNDEKKRKEAEQFIRRFRAKASKARAVQSRIRALEKQKRLERLSRPEDLDFEFNALACPGKSLLRIEDLCFAFHGHEPPLIQGLTISVGKNDRIGIVGKNGKGKTTLANLLAGELTPLGGTIHSHPKATLAYFGQTNIERLDPDKTVEEEILDVHPDHNRSAARNICGLMMFEGDQATKKIRVLSGGEKSRVLLGKLLVTPANLLLLDEPTNHLDMDATESMLEAIDAFPGAVMIVTHSEMILNAIATRLIVFDDGQVRIFEGTYQDFLERVGWANEGEEEPGNEKQGEAQRVNKKESRRMRAEIIAERGKALGELKKRIADLEKAIMDLEKEVDRDTEALMESSREGHGESIQRLSISVHQSREKIEMHFRELETLMNEHDIQAQSFDEKLNAPHLAPPQG